jgi:4-oxalocrotonate tautomerase
MVALVAVVVTGFDVRRARAPVGDVPALAGRGGEPVMPEVTIQMVEGRTLEQKRELARRVTDLLVEVCKVDPSAVLVVFHENKREDKAKGGVLFSDR